VKAEKEGFVLTGPDANGNFNAHKLAEVIVEVLDKADGKPLQVSYLHISLNLNKFFYLHSCPYMIIQIQRQYRKAYLFCSTNTLSPLTKKHLLSHQFILLSHIIAIVFIYLILEKPCLHQTSEGQEN
jgi:hypothetical protein